MANLVVNLHHQLVKVDSALGCTGQRILSTEGFFVEFADAGFRDGFDEDDVVGGFAVLVIRGGNPRTTDLNFTIGLVVPGDFLALLYIHDAEFDAWYDRAGPGFDAELFFR